MCSAQTPGQEVNKKKRGGGGGVQPVNRKTLSLSKDNHLHFAPTPNPSLHFKLQVVNMSFQFHFGMCLFMAVIVNLSLCELLKEILAINVHNYLYTHAHLYLGKGHPIEYDKLS